MKAVIKGEVHSSRKDKRALLDIDLSQFDAVFKEGRDNNTFNRDISLVYALFSIGHIVFRATFGKLYVSTDDFEQQVENEGVDFFDDIDTDFEEVYSLISTKKRVLLLFPALIVAALPFGIFLGFVEWVTVRTAPSYLRLVFTVATLALILLFGFAWACAYFQLVLGSVTRARDEYMAENIIEIAEREGYDSIVVSCGDGHCRGISTRLEEKGWETDVRRTENPVGKLAVWKDQSLRKIRHPRRFLRRLYSRRE